MTRPFGIPTEAEVSDTSPRRPAIARLPDVLRRTGLGRSTLYALVAEGAFPPPVKLSVRAVGWRADEVDGWLVARTLAR